MNHAVEMIVLPRACYLHQFICEEAFASTPRFHCGFLRGRANFINTSVKRLLLLHLGLIMVFCECVLPSSIIIDEEAFASTPRSHHGFNEGVLPSSIRH